MYNKRSWRHVFCKTYNSIYFFFFLHGLFWVLLASVEIAFYFCQFKCWTNQHFRDSFQALNRKQLPPWDSLLPDVAEIIQEHPGSLLPDTGGVLSGCFPLIMGERLYMVVHLNEGEKIPLCYEMCNANS